MVGMNKPIKKEFDLQYLKGVGPKRAEILMKEGFYNCKDLLNYFPRSYIDRSRVDSLKALSIKLIKDKNYDEIDINDFNLKSEITVLARISDMQVKEFGKRGFLKIIIRDDTGGRASIMFWNYYDYYKKLYKVGDLISVSGKVEIDTFNQITFNQPELQKFDDDSDEEDFKGSIIPVYRITDKMKRGGINNRNFRTIVNNALLIELKNIEETLPDHILSIFGYEGLADAVRALHFPSNFNEVVSARNRMKFEEIFFFELYLALRQNGVKITEKGIVINPKSPTARKVFEDLPFELTSDQKKVIREISDDMKSGYAMNRLLQGDVGSGKTIVAMLCMLSVIDDGYQVALMAPTEILVEQHYHTFQKLLKDYDINVVQLVGGQKKSIRQQVLSEILSGEAKIIIGTHSLFESTVEYNKLGLVVIDEQHRFGVNQRADLKAAAKRSHDDALSPHILVMSATPIPRTLALTVYGDLEVSVIRQMPKNRKPIKTKVVFESQLDKVYTFIKEEIALGRQAYIVFPLVEKSEKLELKSAVEHFELLANDVFPKYKCGLLHGQMFWYEKEEVMSGFLNKEYDIIVATTVIEVGIDVPNASVMLINNAERFGLSQLHQLRGRVGRGAEQSYCYLATKENFKYEFNRKGVDEDEQKATIIRLKTMERTTDGFEISEVDMKLRGPGDVLGTRQSGLPAFKFLDLASDGDLISLAKKTAFDIVRADSNLSTPENEILYKSYKEKYQKESNYFDIA